MRIGVYIRSNSEGAAGESRRRHSPGGKAEFLPSFVALQEAVGEACAARVEWEAKIAAGIGAVLEFAAADPDAALTLTVRARRENADQGDREDEVLAYFVELLEQTTPEERLVVSTAGVVEAIATVVRGHLRAGSAAQLPALAPELVYMALMPYTGLAGAQRWSDSLSPPT